MALITVNAGQCGNQVGFEVLNALYENTRIAGLPERDSYFRLSQNENRKPIARAVCLDTEPKAVLSCLQRCGRKVSIIFNCATLVIFTPMISKCCCCDRSGLMTHRAVVTDMEVPETIGLLDIKCARENS